MILLRYLSWDIDVPKSLTSEIYVLPSSSVSFLNFYIYPMDLPMVVISVVLVCHRLNLNTSILPSNIKLLPNSHTFYTLVLPNTNDKWDSSLNCNNDLHNSDISDIVVDVISILSSFKLGNILKDLNISLGNRNSTLVNYIPIISKSIDVSSLSFNNYFRISYSFLVLFL